MATEVARKLSITYENATTYMTAANCSLGVSALGTKMAVRLYLNGSKDGYATLNDTAKSVLFPNGNAHPTKLDLTFVSGLLSSNTSCFIALEFDNTEVKKVYPSVAGEKNWEDIGIADSAVTGSASATEIRWHLHANSTVNAVSMTNTDITLYFWQYTCAAQKAGNGVQGVSCSNAAPYEGDSVTYTATLKPSATWHGWYSDAACTQLVSTEQSYTVVAGADTTLYASATVESGTGLYVRDGGSYTEVQAVYRKVNGVYVQQDDIAGLLDTNTKYIKGD